MTDHLFILAARKHQAREFIRAKGLDPARCRIITCACELRGHRDFPFAYAAHPGDAIMREAADRGVEVTDVESWRA